MDVLRRIKLLDVIDAIVHDDPRSKVSTSDCVAVMLSAIFVGDHDLYGVRERLERYDMPTIMRDPGFSIQEFPEERLDKAMDDLWAAGPEKLMFAIATQVITAFRLDTRYFHFDTTSLTSNIPHILSGISRASPSLGRLKNSRQKIFPCTLCAGPTGPEFGILI